MDEISAEVVDAGVTPEEIPEGAPEIVEAAPEPIRFGAASRQFSAEFSPEEWAGMSDSARAKVEALGKTLGDIDGGFRTIQGRLDQEREAKIAAESRAKAFEEMRSQPQQSAAPAYSDAQLAQSLGAWTDRSEKLRAAGYDTTEADQKAAVIRGEIHRRQEAAREASMRETIRAEMRGVLDAELAPVREMRFAQEEDRTMGAFAQHYQIPKTEVERLAKTADAMLERMWQRPIGDIRREAPDARRDFIEAIIVGARSGIVAPARNPGSGATRPNPGLPSQGSRSAGMTPTTRPTNGTSGQSWRPSLSRNL